MSVPKIVLKQFNEAYPQAKLREISEKTGIQITRVFRILNGAEMKVSELERFQSTFDSPKANITFIELSKKCALNLSSRKRIFLQGLMEQALKLDAFQSPVNSLNLELCHDL